MPNEATPSTALALDDLNTVEGMSAAHPDKLPVATLRWQLRHRDTNGLAFAVVRVGKKLLISQSRYEQWLSTRAGVAA